MVLNSPWDDDIGDLSLGVDILHWFLRQKREA